MKNNNSEIRILSSLSFVNEDGKGESCELVTKDGKFYVIKSDRKNFGIKFPMVFCETNCDFNEAWKVYCGAVEDFQYMNLIENKPVHDCTEMRYKEGRSVGTPEEKKKIANAILLHEDNWESHDEKVDALTNPAEDEVSNKLSFSVTDALNQIIDGAVTEIEESEVAIDDYETKLADATDDCEKDRLAFDIATERGAIAYRQHLIEECRGILFRKKEDKGNA